MADQSVYSQDPTLPSQHSTRTNMAADGEGLMTIRAHVDWFARALLLFNRSLLRQLPARYDIRLDPKKFLDSISFTDGGDAERPSSWAFAPDASVQIPNLSSNRLADGGMLRYSSVSRFMELSLPCRIIR